MKTKLIPIAQQVQQAVQRIEDLKCSKLSSKAKHKRDPIRLYAAAQPLVVAAKAKYDAAQAACDAADRACSEYLAKANAGRRRPHLLTYRNSKTDPAFDKLVVAFENAEDAANRAENHYYEIFEHYASAFQEMCDSLREARRALEQSEHDAHNRARIIDSENR